MSIPSSFTFTEQQLVPADTQDKKELIVFQYLCSLERDIPTVSKDILKSHQSSIESSVLKIANSTTTKPSSATRQLIARVFVALYDHGETRSLFDTLSQSQATLSNKKFDDIVVKRCLIHLVGHLSQYHGQKIASLFAESIAIFLKLYGRAKESDIGYRHEILLALNKTINGCGKLCTEQQVKDLVKVAKAGMIDKYQAIQDQSLQLMISLYQYTAFGAPYKVEEYETYLTYYFKLAEPMTSDRVKRQVVKCAATLLHVAIAPTPEIINAVVTKRAKKGVQTTDSTNEPLTQIIKLEEALSFISAQLIKFTSRQIRASIFETYYILFRNLGVPSIESNFTEISNHLLGLCSQSKITSTSWSDSLFIRSACSFILKQFGKSLSENAEINMVNEYITAHIKKWPAILPTDTEPNHLTLTCALTQISYFLVDLGSATSTLKDALSESLLGLSAHPSESVNLSLAWAFKVFCYTTPTAIPGIMDKLTSALQKDSTMISQEKPEILRRFIGHGNLLSAVISSIMFHPLHVPFEYSAKLFGFALQLLKQASASLSNSSGKDFRATCAQSQVAWTLISSLMTLGPNFVRSHMSQLFLLWKTMFSKVTTKESLTEKGENNLMQHIVMKETGLGAVLSFLHHNTELVTSDVSKRIALFLNNVGSFLTSLPDSYGSPVFGTKLLDRELNLKKRLFQCCLELRQKSSFESNHGNFLKLAMEVFGSDLERTLAKFNLPNGEKPNQVNNPTTDVLFCTSLVQGFKILVAPGLKADDRSLGKVISDDSETAYLYRVCQVQHMKSTESDPLRLIISDSLPKDPQNNMHAKLPTSNSLLIDLIDISIELFAELFPLQDASSQEKYIQQLIEMLKLACVKPVNDRKLYIQTNILTAVVGVLKHCITRNGTLAGGRVPLAIRELVDECMIGPDPNIRNISADIVGRLAQVVGTPMFVGGLVQNIVDRIVKNRDPESRSGDSLALGCIMSYVGGIAGSSQLKNIVGILHSLSTDPHPLVHSWALHALCLSVDGASVTFGSYVNSTLSLIVRLLMSEHHESTSPQVKDNQDNFDVLPSVGRLLYALLAVIGPELSFSVKLRDLCFNVFDYLKQQMENPMVVIEAIRCIQHLFLFAPQFVPIQQVVQFLQIQIQKQNAGSSIQMRQASITCLYQLTQKSPEIVLESAIGNQLEEQLLAMLDLETDSLVLEGIKDILLALLRNVAPNKPSRWIQLCKNILSRVSSNDTQQQSGATSSGAPSAIHGGEDDEDDEEGEHKAGSNQYNKRTTGSNSTASQFVAPKIVVTLTPRWRTQVFVVNCVIQVLQIIQQQAIKEHLDLKSARMKRQLDNNVDYVVFRVADLIGMAFNASTSPIKELNIAGLRLLKDILVIFSDCPDPDVEEQRLLGQYQAQINSALTPTLSYKVEQVEVSSLACQVGAFYVTSGVIEDRNVPNSRVVRCLMTMLDSCQAIEQENSNQQASNSQLLFKLKVAVLSAWAQLYYYSGTKRQVTLQSLIEQKLQFIASEWLSMLEFFCRLSAEASFKDYRVNLTSSDATSGNAGSKAGALDGYMMATSEILLPYMKEHWMTFMDVMTLCVAAGYQDIKKTNVNLTLLGICIDELSHRQQSDNVPHILDIMGRVLKVYSMKDKVDVRILQDVLEICRHLAYHETLGIQLAVASLVHVVADIYPSQGEEQQQKGTKDEDGPTTFADILSQALLCIATPFTIFVPGIASNPTSRVYSSQPSSPQVVQLLATSIKSSLTLIDKNWKPDTLIPFTLTNCLAIILSDKYAQDAALTALGLLSKLLGFSESRFQSFQHKKFLFSILGECSEYIENHLPNTPDDEITDLELTKLKNVMLTLTMVLLQPFKIVHVSSIEILCHVLDNDKSTVSAIALQCISSLMGNRPDLIPYLLSPILKRFLKTVSELLESKQEVSTNCAMEFKSVFDCLSFVSVEERVKMIAILIVAFQNILSSETFTGTRQFSLNCLLALAKSHQESVKVLISQMQMSDRSKLEGYMNEAVDLSVQQQQQQQQQNQYGTSIAPLSKQAISLKSFV